MLGLLDGLALNTWVRFWCFLNYFPRVLNYFFLSALMNIEHSSPLLFDISLVYSSHRDHKRFGPTYIHSFTRNTFGKIENIFFNPLFHLTHFQLPPPPRGARGGGGGVGGGGGGGPLRRPRGGHRRAGLHLLTGPPQDVEAWQSRCE